MNATTSWTRRAARGPLGLMVAGAVLAAATALPAAAADWPTDTVRIVVPWRAGGGTDTIARAFAAAMEGVVDQPVVVENITAGAGTAGMMAVKNAAPDGHTMMLNGSSDLNSPIIFRAGPSPFGLDDYVCAGAFYQTPTWVLAHKDQGLTDLGQFIEKAKAHPGELTIGVGSLTSAHYVLAAAIKGMNDIDVRIIPFDGGGPLLKALLGNQVTIGVIHSPVLLNEVKSGMIDVLATGGDLSGISYEPVRGTKSVAEFNTPVEVGVTRGLFLPKDTPPEVLSKVEAVVEKAAKSDSFAAFGAKFGFVPVWMNGKAFCDFMNKEQADYRDIKAKYIDGKQ